jgi:DNA-binding protein YbaB
MFGFDSVPDFSVRDPESVTRAQREQFSRLQELHEQVGQLTGTAESEDGRLSVAYSERGGVHNLRIDPRALRMPSEDLAAAIEQLVNDARADFHRQTSEVVQKSVGDSVNPQALLDNLPQMEANLGEILNVAKQSSNDIAAMAQRLMGAFESMQRGNEGAGPSSTYRPGAAR